jgi:hypothetical protein
MEGLIDVSDLEVLERDRMDRFNVEIKEMYTRSELKIIDNLFGSRILLILIYLLYVCFYEKQ